MDFIQRVTEFIIPVIILIILVSGFYNEVKIYDCFIDGAKEGMQTIIKILPHLVGLMVAIGALRESGALELLAHGLNPILSVIRLPPEVVPLALMRPISGSASLAIVSDLVNNYGPDTFIGRVTSTMMGSTETTFYTLAIYFGSVGIKKIRHTLICALIADVTGIICSVWVCGIILGWK